MAFLSKDGMVSLLNRLTNHFPTGEIAYNSYTRFTIRAVKRSRGAQSVADLVKSPDFDDPREPEHWNPKLKLIKEILLSREQRSPSFRRSFACTTN